MRILALLIFLFAFVPCALADEQLRVGQLLVEVRSVESGFELGITADKLPEGVQVSAFFVPDPSRLVLDVTPPIVASPNEPKKKFEREYPLQTAGLRRMRIGEYSKRLRIVVDLGESLGVPSASPQTAISGNYIRVIAQGVKLPGSEAAVTTTPTTSSSTTTAVPTTTTTVTTGTSTTTSSLSTTTSTSSSSTSSSSTTTTTIRTTSTTTTSSTTTTAKRTTTTTTSTSTTTTTTSSSTTTTAAPTTTTTTTSSTTTTTERRATPTPSPEASVFQGVTFKMANDGSNGSLQLQFNRRVNYTLLKKAETEIVLIFESASAAGEFLTLEQFPPAGFSGIEAVIPRMQGSDLEVSIILEPKFSVESSWHGSTLVVNPTH